MKKINYVFILILLITFSKIEYALGQIQKPAQTGTWYVIYDETEHNLGVSINTYHLEQTINYPVQDAYFEAKRSKYSVDDYRISLECYTNNSWVTKKTIDAGKNSYNPSDWFNIPNNTTKIRFKRHAGSLSRYISNIKITMAPHTRLTENGTINPIQLSSVPVATTETHTIKFYSFLTKNSGKLTAEIVNITGNKAENTILKLSTYEIAGSNKLDKITDETGYTYSFNLIYTPQSIENINCSIKITNHGVGEIYIPVTLSSSLSAPTLKCDASGYTFAKLSWNKINGATSYKLYDNNTLKGTYTTNTITLTDLQYNSNHSYTITSVVGSAESNKSNTIKIECPEYPKIQKTSTTEIKQNQATLSWSPATLLNNHTCVKYHIQLYKENILIKDTTTTSTTITFTNLIDTTTYKVKFGVEYKYTLNGTQQTVAPNKNKEEHWVSYTFTTPSFIPKDPFDGIIKYKDVWYRVNLNNEIDISNERDKEYIMSLNYPCQKKVDFFINTTKFIADGTANIKVDENKTDNWNDTNNIRTIHNKSYAGKNVSGTTETSGEDVKALKFYCYGGPNSDEYIHDIGLTIAPHILLKSNKYTTITEETSTQTTKATIDFGTIEIDHIKPINISFKSFLSVGKITAQLSDDTNNDVFKLINNNNSKQITIADNNTLKQIDNNDYHFTITFNPNKAQDEEHIGYLIIKDDKHTSTITLKGKCIKKTPEISWINNNYIRLGETLTGVATSTYGSITLQSQEPTIIDIENNILEGKKIGQTQITAKINETDKYYGVTESITFYVTDKIIQTIDWNQNFDWLDITSADIALTAKAITHETGEENGNKIAYSSADENIVTIIDGKLHIVGTGHTTITASQQGDNDYAPTSMTKIVFIRNKTGGCNNFYALQHDGNSYGDDGTGFDWGPHSFSADLNTIGETITFRTSKTYDVLGMFDTTDDKIIITDNLGNTIYENTLSDGKNIDNNDKGHIITGKINREATSLTFTLKGNFNVAIRDIIVTPAIYLEANCDIINFTTTKVDLKSIEEIDFYWANQPDFARATIIDDNAGVFSIDNNTAIFGSSTCGENDTSTVKIKFAPKEETTYTAKLAIYVGNDEKPKITIPINGKGQKADQEIYWLNYPISTADKEINLAKTTASKPQKITYTIISGANNIKINSNNTITILNAGKFKISAKQEGNNSYKPTETITKEFEATIGQIIFDNKACDQNWETNKNWKPISKLNFRRNVLPEDNVNLIIKSHSKISDNFHNKNEINIDNEGSITIDPQGKLKANTINSTSNKITLKADENSSAILLFKNDNTKKIKATIELYSQAFSQELRNGEAGNFQDPKWQYLGITAEKINYTAINPNGTTNWIYRWDETGNKNYGCWVEKLKQNSTLEAWKGYCLAQEKPTTYAYQGTLINTDHKYNLTYTPSTDGIIWPDLGNNLITNSYTAPIDITSLSDKNFINAEASIYIYNTGSYYDWKNNQTKSGVYNKSKTKYNPGQFIVIPVNVAKVIGEEEIPQTIASGQAFFVVANKKDASLTIDYESNVYDTEQTTNTMRAPQKILNDFNVLKIQITNKNSNDRLYLLEHSSTTENFDNGYDANKIFDNPTGLQIYATTTFGYTSINTNKSFDGQHLGVIADNETELYTISFNIDKLHTYNELYLYDSITNIHVDILAGEIYQFYGSKEKNDNRFIITSTRRNIPESDNDITTNTEKVTIEDVISQNKPIYIYNSIGQLIDKHENITNFEIQTSNYPTGIYFITSENKTAKLVIK